MFLVHLLPSPNLGQFWAWGLPGPEPVLSGSRLLPTALHQILWGQAAERQWPRMAWDHPLYESPQSWPFICTPTTRLWQRGELQGGPKLNQAVPSQIPFDSSVGHRRQCRQGYLTFGPSFLYSSLHSPFFSALTTSLLYYLLLNLCWAFVPLCPE